MVSSWHSLVSLFQRSHTWLLLERFVERYGSPAGKKLDFKLLAQAQEEFEHLCEVFEQDLRIGEVSDAVVYCRDDHVAVLKSAVWRLSGNDGCLCVRSALVAAADKVRADSWG